MKKALAGVGLTVMLSVGSVAGSATAGADELSVLTTVAQMGISPNDGSYVTTLRWGYAVCADKSIWVPLDTTVNNLVWSPENHISYQQATALAIAANTDLC